MSELNESINSKTIRPRLGVLPRVLIGGITFFGTSVAILGNGDASASKKVTAKEASMPKPKTNLCDSGVISALIAKEMQTTPAQVTCSTISNIYLKSFLISDAWSDENGDRIVVNIEANKDKDASKTSYWNKLETELHSGKYPESLISSANSINGRPAIWSSNFSLATLFTKDEVVVGSIEFTASSHVDSSNEEIADKLISTIELEEL